MAGERLKKRDLTSGNGGHRETCFNVRASAHYKFFAACNIIYDDEAT